MLVVERRFKDAVRAGARCHRGAQVFEDHRLFPGEQFIAVLPFDVESNQVEPRRGLRVCLEFRMYHGNTSVAGLKTYSSLPGYRLAGAERTGSGDIQANAVDARLGGEIKRSLI